MKVRFELVGITPMLLHNDDVEAADILSEWRKAPENKNVSRPGDDRSPAWTWQAYTYHDGTHLALPSDNLMSCMRTGATQMILKKQKTFKEISQSGMMMTSEYLTLKISGKQVLFADVLAVRDQPFAAQQQFAVDHGFRLWVKRARVGTSKHIRVRPRLESWSVDGVINVRVQEITFEVLAKMFELAGNVGLCDWRPGCKTPGPFGMFKATLKEVK